MNLATLVIIQPRDTKLNMKIAVYFMQKHSISNIKCHAYRCCKSIIKLYYTIYKRGIIATSFYFSI